MKEYTLMDSLFLHIYASVENFKTEIDKSVETEDNLSIKNKIMELESFIFCINLLVFELKIQNKMNTDNDSKILVDIITDLFSYFNVEYKDNNQYLFFSSIEKYLSLYIERYNIYQKMMIKGTDHFIKSYINIINCEFDKLMIIDNFSLKMLNKLPLSQKWKVAFRGSFELFDKTINNIKKIITYFFNDGITYFYNNINNLEIIKYHQKNIDCTSIVITRQ